MKLDFIETYGFRGFRDRLRVEFASGFTVLSGRNGIGKSTICDAIEFAITGQIDKYRVEKAARESLGDYLWWRGEGRPAKHYVTVSFSHEDGRTFTITRDRATGSNQSPETIEKELCVAGAKPIAALQQLCRTSIIRDEWISALSLDLTETERFELVRAALGAIEGPDFTGKAKEIISLVEEAAIKAEGDYEEAREHLNLALTQLSEARDTAARAGDLQVALSIIDNLLPTSTGDLSAKITAARSILARQRMRLAETERILEVVRDYGRLLGESQNPSFLGLKAQSSKELQTVNRDYQQAEAELQQARQRLAAEQAADAFAASLAALWEHGAKVGLIDDHCPLCDARRTPAQFEAGIEKARARLDSLRSGAASARAEVSDLEKRLKDLADRRSRAERQVAQLLSQENIVIGRRQKLLDMLKSLELDATLADNPAALETQIADERSRLIDLERSILTLEASQAIDQVTSLEARVESLRSEVDVCASRLSQAHDAVDKSKAIEHAVRRTNSEILEERLASIRPMLNELYQRLRPHVKWRTIGYNIRGDLRRFLSLTIGDNLNPQFIFSSGQRRATGLAFLLSVHLSRPWCRWKTLLLDDPVQHIDDYRALHLVEVLAAIRQDGRQIVCTVEDAALADLVCRRLRRGSLDEGLRIDLDTDKSGEPVVSKVSRIPPMPTSVLQRSLAAVG